MDKVKIGVIGGGRGKSMIRYGREASNAQLVAICDFRDDVLDRMKKECGEDGISFYSDYDEFLKHDMDAVVLANYANQHAPFAIKAMKAGKHVFSEVLPVQTLKEAVELIETVEETGKVYAYGENYCFMSAPYEMRKLYRQGLIGEFEYGEGEYVHNCEPIWPEITYGEPDHWRNNMYATFYCTHSIGPMIHITGLRPVKVTGFEGPKTERKVRVGSKSGSFGVELIQLENGGIFKSIHGDLYVDSIWYSLYGSKGNMESARESAQNGAFDRIYIHADEYSGGYDTTKKDTYLPTRAQDEQAKSFGHGTSDFYTMYNFVRKIQGDPDADIIDVYEALDMFLPGLFAYRSILNGGIPMEIPNLRDKAVRDLYRNDTACTDPSVAGDQLIPVFSKGNPEIPDAIYQEVKRKWEIEKAKSDNA